MFLEFLSNLRSKVVETTKKIMGRESREIQGRVEASQPAISESVSVALITLFIGESVI